MIAVYHETPLGTHNYIQLKSCSFKGAELETTIWCKEYNNKF